jgi:hypothetical protein
MKYILLIIFIFVFSFSAFGQAKPGIVESTVAQSGNYTKEESEILAGVLLNSLVAANCGYEPNNPVCKTNAADLAELYTKISRSPKLIKILAAQAVTDYERIRPQIKSAPQASQVADEQNAQMLRLLVIQNQRIIELLEKLLTKK